MDLDEFESVEGRDIELERVLGNRLYEQYVERYKTEMEKLSDVEDFVNDNSFHNVSAKYHIMYKLKCGDNGSTRIISKDGNRAYEFLVEFDTKDPEYGIYYGCRGLILGGNQEEEIIKFQKEWLMIRRELTKILNNTFVNKDFSRRFRMTNNVNNKTFWPFWIALYDDEDVTDVATTALRLMANVYRHAINQNWGGILLIINR